MNNEVMGGVVISLVSERPDKLLRRSGLAASSLPAQFVTLRGILFLMLIFLQHNGPQTIPPATFQKFVPTTRSSAGGMGDGRDKLMEEKRGKVRGRKKNGKKVSERRREDKRKIS